MNKKKEYRVAANIERIRKARPKALKIEIVSCDEVPVEREEIAQRERWI